MIKNCRCSLSNIFKHFLKKQSSLHRHMSHVEVFFVWFISFSPSLILWNIFLFLNDRKLSSSACCQNVMRENQRKFQRYEELFVFFAFCDTTKEHCRESYKSLRCFVNWAAYWNLNKLKILHQLLLMSHGIINNENLATTSTCWNFLNFALNENKSLLW